MTEHVRCVVKRASEVATSLFRVMLNIGGPRSSKRRVVGGVINSIILYGARVWHRVLRYEKYRNMSLQVQRRVAPRVCSAYRTVSTEAVLVVIAGFIPINLMVEERVATHGDAEEDMKALREETIKNGKSDETTLGAGRNGRVVLYSISQSELSGNTVKSTSTRLSSCRDMAHSEHTSIALGVGRRRSAATVARMIV